jgi:hypothetical protein
MSLKRKSKFLPFKEAREVVRAMGMKSNTVWRIIKKQKLFPINIPKHPNKYYREWIDWSDWLGVKHKEHLSFEEAKKVVKAMDIKNSTEWRKIIKSQSFPMNIPKYPEAYYKEWVSWYNWTDTKPKEYLSFKEARKFARSLKLRTQGDWYKFCKSGKLPTNIPIEVRSFYSKRKTWTSWNDFLNIKTFLGCYRKYYVNHDYFKKWSHNMAYILGFWFADGCIMFRKGGYVFSIRQHKKDRYLLEDMLKDMKTNYKLYNDSKNDNCCTLLIHSKEIFNDIKKLGGTERKSLTCKFPNVPKKYLPDFIRGYFDGDGHIGSNFNGCHSSFASGSKDFIYKLHKVLKENIKNIKGHIGVSIREKGTEDKWRTTKKKETCYNLQFYSNDTRRLRDFIYSTPCKLKMIRKW